MKKRTKPAESANKRDKNSPKETPHLQESRLFPSVGVGASSDGLDAEPREENARLKSLLEAGG